MDVIHRDCTIFVNKRQEILSDCDAEEAGRDFWFTRNRHGVSFEDGSYPEPYKQLLKRDAMRFPEVCVYIGEDGWLHLM